MRSWRLWRRESDFCSSMTALCSSSSVPLKNAFDSVLYALSVDFFASTTLASAEISSVDSILLRVYLLIFVPGGGVAPLWFSLAGMGG